MGQYEVFKWLKNQAEMGKEDWFTPQEVCKGLQEQGATRGETEGVRKDLIKLSISRCILIKDLDTTGLNNYKRVFKYEIITLQKKV